MTGLPAASLIALCLLVGPGSPAAAGAAPGTPAGLLDLSSAGLPPAATVDLSMGRAELALMAAATVGDPDAAALLAGLEAVHLRQYVAPDSLTLDAARALPAQLEASGWVRARYESHGTEHVYIYAMSSHDAIAGLTVVVIDATRLVAIANVVGDIPPAQLRQLGLPIIP